MVPDDQDPRDINWGLPSSTRVIAGFRLNIEETVFLNKKIQRESDGIK